MFKWNLKLSLKLLSVVTWNLYLLMIFFFSVSSFSNAILSSLHLSFPCHPFLFFSQLELSFHPLFFQCGTSILVSELSLSLGLKSKPTCFFPCYHATKISKNTNNSVGSCLTFNMSCMTLKERFEALIKNFKAVTSTNKELKNQTEELKSHNKCFRHQFRGKRRPDLSDHEIKVPKFEGKLDPDEFLRWHYNIERIFNYHKVPWGNKGWACCS